MTWHRFLIVPFIGVAASVGCGSADADGGGGDAGAAGTAGTAGAAGADAGSAGSGGSALPCPAPAKAAGAAPVSGTSRGLWAQSVEKIEGTQLVAGDPKGGAFAVLRGFSNGEPIAVGSDTVYAGGAASFFVIVARFDPDGSIPWAKAIAPVVPDLNWKPDFQIAGADGAVLITMPISVEVDVAGTSVNAAAAKTLLVARVSATGADWTASFGNAEATPQAAAVDPQDGAVFGLAYEAPVDLGGGIRDCSLVFLRIDQTGKRLFDRCMSSLKPGFFKLDGLAIDAAGDMIASGFPLGPVDVGTGPVSVDSSGGASILFKMSGTDGTTQWSTVFRGNYSRQIGTDTKNNILTIGHVPNYNDETLLSDDSVKGCSREDVYDYHLTTLDAAGKRVRTVFFSDARGVAFSPDGHTYVIAPGDGTPFAPGLDPPTKQQLVALDPEGGVRFLQDLAADGSGNLGTPALALDGLGNLYVLAGLMGTLSLENGKGTTVPSGFGAALVRFDTKP